MATARVVRIDDTHPNIRYIGPWEEIDGTPYNDKGANGQTFRSTLHRLTRDSGTFEFSFSGGGGDVRGTRDYPGDPGLFIPDPSKQAPTITCTIDGVDVHMWAFHNGFAANNFEICRWGGLTGPHVLTVNVSFPPPKPGDSAPYPFLFDYISFEPSKDQRIDNETTTPAMNDPAITWNGTWGQSYSSTPSVMLPLTNDDGSSVYLTFNGTGIQVIGQIHPVYTNQHNEFINGTSMATFFVDNQYRGQSVIEDKSPDRRYMEYNYKLLEVPDLRPGVHNLSIVYRGNSSTLPLILQDFNILRDYQVLDGDGTGGPPPVPTPVPTSEPVPEKKPGIPVGLIIGLAVGGLVLLIGIAFGIWKFVKWRRGEKSRHDSIGPNSNSLLARLSSGQGREMPRPYERIEGRGEGGVYGDGLSGGAVMSEVFLPSPRVPFSSSAASANTGAAGASRSQGYLPSKFGGSSSLAATTPGVVSSVSSAFSRPVTEVSPLSDVVVVQPPPLPRRHVEVVEHPPMYTAT